MHTRLPAIGGVLLAVLATTLACGGDGDSAGASFTGMGEAPGGFPSIARGISDNGVRVVGGSGEVGDQGFRWFSGTGTMTSIGSGENFPGGEVRNLPAGANGDGKATVGASEYETGKMQAYLYLIPGTPGDVSSFDDPRFQRLGFLPDGTVSIATAVSDDIEVVVGYGEYTSGTQAFRYTPAGKMVGLGFLPGESAFSAAYALSSEGKVIVGESDSAQGVEAFIWNRTDKMVSLGTMSSTPHDVARAVSADGLIVAGGLATESSGEGREAFLWTQGAGFRTLGDLPGGAFDGVVNALSADGKVAVGSSSTGADQLEAFIWDATLGMRNLRSVLVEEFGLDLEGWRLESAVAVSADGQTIAGTGINPAGQAEGWIAMVPRSDIETE